MARSWRRSKRRKEGLGLIQPPELFTAPATSAGTAERKKKKKKGYEEENEENLLGFLQDSVSRNPLESHLES